MTHPITPPPELVLQWMQEFNDPQHCHWEEYETGIATRAAQWGADQELEACCWWLDQKGWSGESRQLRAVRRPKPPSLKEQALEALGRFNSNAHTNGDEMTRDFDLLRRAVEQLNN